jgi:DNA gyrase/topoisomerase IV subunit A
MLIGLEQPLLLVTNHYRFLLTTPQRIAELSQVGMSLGEFYQLKDEEIVSAITPWNLIRECSRLILVTNPGFARGYSLVQMVENIEGPASLMFDQPLPGATLAVMGSNEDDYLTSISSKGRASRIQTSRLRQQGQYIIKLSKGERLNSAITAQVDDELLLVTSSGFGRRLPVEWIPESVEGKTAGRSMISRPDLRAVELIKRSKPIWMLTETSILALDPEVIPQDNEGTKKTYSLVEVKAGRRVLGLVSDFQHVD